MNHIQSATFGRTSNQSGPADLGMAVNLRDESRNIYSTIIAFCRIAQLI